MWLIDLGLTHFQGPLVALAIFRILFAATCLIKFWLETSRGYWSMYDTGSYLYFAGHHPTVRAKIPVAVYKVLYVLKFPAAVLLLLGVWSQAACLILFIVFLVDGKVHFKYHAHLYALLAFCLCLTNSCERALNLSSLLAIASGANATVVLSKDAAVRGSILSQAMIVATIAVMYISSAVKKLQSPDFMPGVTLFQTIRTIIIESPRRKHQDAWYPQWFVRYISTSTDEQLIRHFRPMMWAVTMLEFVMPIILLFNEKLWCIGTILGIGMHVGITSFYPIQLVPFNLGTIICYVLFVDPNRAAEAFIRLIG